MKLNTSALIGSALDWAVAKAENMQFAPVAGAGSIWFKLGVWTQPSATGGQRPYVMRHEYQHWVKECEGGVLRRGTYIWEPSTDWSQGGPIIDQLTRRGLRIHGMKCRYRTDETSVNVDVNGHYAMSGPNILIAAMRCFVASKLGDAVEVPEELL